MEKSMVQRMIEARQDRDETQRQLADAIGWHHIQIAKYETGVNTPPISYLEAFCRHYNISADYLLGLPEGLDWR